MTRLEDLGAWPARVAWVLLALVAGATVGDAIDGRSTAVRLAVLAGVSAGWGAGLVALLVPRTGALTVLRVVVPAGLAAVLASTVAGGPVDGLDVAAVAVAAVATLAVLAPWVGEAWIDGSSYGAEHRLPLRAPAALSLLLAPLTWAAVVAAAAVGPLLLAAGQWVAGGAATVVGAGVVWAGSRSLHQLARRWVVLVPTGLVLHDPLTMPEPQLFLRTTIAGLGPALADSTADDLTAGAPGLALQLQLSEPVELLVRGPGRETATHETTAILLTPSRPSHLLDRAREHRIPVA